MQSLNRSINNGLRLTSALALTLFVFLCLGLPMRAQMSGAYSINPAIATGGTNYQSFSAAASDLASNGLSGDVTISVAPGTYAESFTIPALSYAGASSWSVTFDGGAGNAAVCVVSAAIAVSGGAVVTLDGADHVTLKNLTIRSTSVARGHGILFTNGADGNVIRDCVIDLPLTATSPNCIGILASSALSYAATGRHGSNNTIQDNTITGGYYGIRWNGFSNSDFTESQGNSFVGNDISGFYYCGIFLYCGGALTVRGNRIVERPLALPGSYGIYGWCLNNGPEISHNFSRANTSLYSYRLNYVTDPGNPDNRARIFNNMMISEGSSTVYGFNMQYPTNADIAFNSCVARSTNGTVHGYYSYRAFATSAAEEIRFRNNIFSCSTTTTINAVNESHVGSNAYGAFDHNMFHLNGSGSNHGYIWNGISYSTLAALQNAVAGLHQNTVEADPMWSSSDDLHSASPAAAGAGIPVPSVTDDFDGDIRSSLPCIGADEFGSCTITCPANIVVGNTPGNCGSVVSFNPTADPGCGIVTCVPPSGSEFPVGTTTVLCTTEAGPQCSFTVTVVDMEPPAIHAVNLSATTGPGRCDAVVTFNPTATDNCSVVGPVTCVPPSGSVFPKGTTSVLCSVTDANGNTASASFDVTVTDAESPVISLAASTTLWPPNRKYVTISVAQMIAAITDNCDPLSYADARIVLATSDEPETGAGSGNTLNDMVIAQDCQSIDLRSERDATTNGRVYNVTLRVSDLSANSSVAVYKVRVPANNSGACVEDAPIYTVASSCGMAKSISSQPVPEGLTLEQNYPNPFNPTTTIVYSVPSGMRATVRVFDSYGRLVQTLADDVAASGTHTLIFDARSLPSGTYFCRLQTDGHILQRTMTLIK